MKRLALNDRSGTDWVNTKEIKVVKAARSYSDIILLCGRIITVSKSLKELLERLAPTGKFVRIHNSHAVNKHEIIRVEALMVVLRDGTQWGVDKQYGHNLDGLDDHLL